MFTFTVREHTVKAAQAGPKLDGLIIDLEEGEVYGSYFTTVPVSALSYRREHPTQARAQVEEKKDSIRFTIYDDWGTPYFLEIDNIHGLEIKAVEDNLLKNELL